MGSFIRSSSCGTRLQGELTTVARRARCASPTAQGIYPVRSFEHVATGCVNRVESSMDPKLKAIIERLNRRLREARKFQDRLVRRIKETDEDLAKLKAQRSVNSKKR